MNDGRTQETEGYKIDLKGRGWLAGRLVRRFIRRSFSEGGSLGEGGRPFFASPKKGEGLSKVTSSKLATRPGFEIKLKGLG